MSLGSPEHWLWASHRTVRLCCSSRRRPRTHGVARAVLSPLLGVRPLTQADGSGLRHSLTQVQRGVCHRQGVEGGSLTLAPVSPQDDIIDDVESFVAAAEILKERGAYKIYVMATHGILSAEAPRLIEESSIDEVCACQGLGALGRSQVAALLPVTSRTTWSLVLDPAPEGL